MYEIITYQISKWHPGLCNLLWLNPHLTGSHTELTCLHQLSSQSDSWPQNINFISVATFSLLYKHTASNLVALGRFSHVGTGEAVNSFFHGLTENLWLCSSLRCLLKKITITSTYFPCLFSGNRNLLLRRVSSTELRSKKSERCSRRGNIQYIVSSREKVGHREKKRRRRRKNKKCGCRLMQANSPET